MRQISATEASRNFSRLLDDVEHGRDSYTIVRRGRAVARLEPVEGASGRALRELIARRPKDAAWSRELTELRSSLIAEERRWHD